MSSSMTTTSVLPPAVREYFDRVLLMTAFPYLIHTRFAQRRNLPEKEGDTIVFRRYSRLPSAVVPIVDGVTPPGVPLSVDDIKARVSWYGRYVTITNQVQYTVQDRVLSEAAELIAQNMGESLDIVTRDVLASTSSVMSCEFGSNGSTPTELTDEDLAAVVQRLLGNDARMISKVVKATDQYATNPIRPSFWGFLSTDLIDDLQDLPSFTSTTNYPGDQSKTILDAEWGSTDNIRWLISSITSVSSATPAVFNNIIVAQEAYGVVNLGSEAGKLIVKPLGSAGSADPLDQRSTVAWSQPFVARILNDSFMVNLLSSHS